MAESAAAKASAKAAKLERFVAKNSARASTAAAARSRARQLEGVREDLEALAEETGGGGDLGDGPGDARRVSLTLPPAPEGAKETLTLTDAAVGYGGGLEPLLTGVNLTVRRGDRLLIVGPNGAGKSTLLRSLGGGLRLAAGTLAHGEGARVGYFSQDLAQELPTEDTPLAHVLRVARAANPTVTEQKARSVLGARGLSGSAAKERRIGHLSGGEKARVRPRRVRAPTSERAPPRRGVQSPRRGCCGRADKRVAGLGRRRGCGDPQQIIRRRARTHRRGARRERCAQDAHGRGRRAVEERFQPGRRRGGRVAGATAAKEEGGDATMGADPEEAAAAAAEAKAAKAARDKLLKEARNAPKVIDKIERALAVIDEDLEEIDARMMACGADVGAAQEIQKERDAKADKQGLYYAEWERLEAVMAEAEETLAAEAARA